MSNKKNKKTTGSKSSIAKKATQPKARKRIVSLEQYEAEARAGATVADVGPTAKNSGKSTTEATVATGGDSGKRDANVEPKRMSILSAAARVLDERDAADGPLTCPQMIERMTAKGYWSPARGGKTPASTLHAALLREIKTKGEDSRFDKVDRGRFALTLKR